MRIRIRKVPAVAGAILMLAASICGAASETVPGTLTVRTGEEFTLLLDEVASVEDAQLHLKITRISYPKLPPGTASLLPIKPVVHYELRVGPVVYSEAGLYNFTGYEVRVTGSDYKTFASFLVFDPVRECESKTKGSGNGMDDCLFRLADRMKDPRFCAKIRNGERKGSCYESRAHDFFEDVLCNKVPEPKRYCLYRKALKTMDIGWCGNPDIIAWYSNSGACYRDFAWRSGKGVALCDELAPAQRKPCRQSLSRKSSPETGQTPLKYYVARTRETALLQGNITVDTVHWKCRNSHCYAMLPVTADKSSIQLCVSLAEKVGRIRSFGDFSGSPMSEREIEECNR